MNRHTYATARALLLATLVPVSGGCDAATDAYTDHEDVPSFRDSHDNGFMMNGFMMNGFMMNGFMMNGFMMNGFMMNGFMMNGFMMNGIDLDGGVVDGLRLTSVETGTLAGQQPIKAISVDGITGELTLTTESDEIIRGTNVEGATWTFSADIDENTTQPYTMTIHQVRHTPAGIYTGGELYSYVFSTSYWDPNLDDWTAPEFAVCTDGDGAPVGALLLPGAWDSESGDRVGDGTDITIACHRAALAKCATWGYRIGNDDPAASDAHQACTRMVRADYTGQGVPYTLNGTLIYVGDALGINYQERHGASTNKEAEWGPDGARCIERFHLRQKQLTGCDGTPGNNDDCWMGQGGDPNIPDCASFELDPETAPDSLITATPYFEVDESYVGVIWQNPSLTVGLTDRDTAGANAYGGETSIYAQESLDGFVRHRAFGFRGFLNDLVGGGTKLVGLWGNGDIDVIGSTIPGRNFHGAANIAADDGRTIYALDDVNDELCTVSILTGALIECKGVVDANDATFDVSHLTDLTADNAEGTRFIMVNGGTELYTLTPNGATWRAVYTGDSPQPLNGIANSVDGKLLGLSYTNNDYIDVDTGVKLSNGGSGGLLIYGDLAALPIGVADVNLGEGPEAEIDGVCGDGELPANADCDGACDPGDHPNSPDCGYPGFCNQFDGRSVTLQSQQSGDFLRAGGGGGGGVGKSTTAGDWEQWTVECSGAEFVWLHSAHDTYLKANIYDDLVQGSNPQADKQQWIPVRSESGAWALKNKGRGKYLQVPWTNVGPQLGEAKHLNVVDVDKDDFCAAHDGADVTIRSADNDRYLDSGLDGAVGSSATADTTWHVKCTNRVVRLRSNETSGFLSARSGGQNADVRESKAPDSRARWIPIFDGSTGTWSFQSRPLGTYLGIDSGTHNAAQTTTVGAEERFIVQ